MGRKGILPTKETKGKEIEINKMLSWTMKIEMMCIMDKGENKN